MQNKLTSPTRVVGVCTPPKGGGGRGGCLRVGRNAPGIFSYIHTLYLRYTNCMIPCLQLPSFAKEISLNTGYGSLEDPRLRGYVFNITEAGNTKPIGSAKAALVIDGPSLLTFKNYPHKAQHKIVMLETSAPVIGYDTWDRPKARDCIYVIRSAMVAREPGVIIKERDGELVFTGHEIEIPAPCTIIYDLDNIHPTGGKVRIET